MTATGFILVSLPPVVVGALLIGRSLSKNFKVGGMLGVAPASPAPRHYRVAWFFLGLMLVAEGVRGMYMHLG